MKSLLFLFCLAAIPAAAQQPTWVHFDPTGAFLVYSNDAMGNRIPDFSYAGYEGGGVAIPASIVVQQTVSPGGGDDTASIQNAINAVEALSPDGNGIRGAVLLNSGTFQLAGTLDITNGGVVLEGMGTNQTILHFTGNSRLCVSVFGSGNRSTVGATYNIVDNYVPLGATSFHVGGSSSIVWGTNTTVTADSDIFTNGTLLYAYNWSGTNQTVNGIAFTGTTSANPGNVAITGIGSYYGNYTSSQPPFSSLSQAYQNLLRGAEYNSGTATATLTMNGLTAGRVYAVQFWVSDPRGGGTIGRTETLSGSNVVVLAYNVPAATGGVGQYSIGVFTATGSSQSFSFVGSASTQINALLVSDVTATGYQPVNPPPPPPPFSVGDTIVIQRPVTQPWIDAIGMSNYWSPNAGLQFERTVTAVNGNQIGIDIPLCNPIEQEWCTGLVYQYTFPGRISQVGLRNFQISADFDDYASNLGAGRAIQFDKCENCWAGGILINHFYNGFNLGNNAKWITVEDSEYVNNTGTNAGPDAFATQGGLNLFLRCGSTPDCTLYHVGGTQAATPGPDVLLDINSLGQAYDCEAHQRWAAGLLYDRTTVASSNGGNTGIKFQNRGGAGSGQGYACGYSVMWNCDSKGSINQIPRVPYHYNWAIGRGSSAATWNHYADDGIFDATNVLVNPHSLYLEQLKERLGGAAVENIGYTLFTISNSPPSQSAAIGTNALYTVSVGDPAGMGNIVALSVASLPPGATAGFSPSSVTGAGTSVLAVTPSSSTPPGVYTLDVIGACAGLSRTNTVSLQVAKPYITRISVSGSTLTITATNGPLSQRCVLLASTNVALPLAQWKPVLTNQFDAFGNLNLSNNIILPNIPWEFYILSQ